MSKLSARALISTTIQLFSLPEVTLRLGEMIEDPSCPVSEIGEAISGDPGLTARLLRIVNSSFYGFPSRVDTVPMAITILGTRQLRDLVLSTSVVDTFTDTQSTVINMKNFWQHSIACGVAAREIATCMQLANSERLFVAGLLHDIGKLVMLSTLEDDYGELIQRLQKKTTFQASYEKEIFGFDHADIAEELLRAWNLPESLVEPVACHHVPARAHQFRHDAYIVNLANAVANRISPAIGDDDTKIVDETWTELGLDSTSLNTLINATKSKLDSVFELIYRDTRKVATG